MIQCAAVCCSVLQGVAMCCSVFSVLQCVAVCCSVLQCVAVGHVVAKVVGSAQRVRANVCEYIYTSEIGVCFRPGPVMDYDFILNPPYNTLFAPCDF